MEKLTAEQALTFVAATSKGAPKIVLDSWLGNGMTPTVGDFNSDDRVRHDCANRYLECLTSVRDSLVEHLRCIPTQQTFFDKENITAVERLARGELGTTTIKTSRDVRDEKEAKLKKKPTQKTAAKAAKKKAKAPTTKKKTPIKKMKTTAAAKKKVGKLSYGFPSLQSRARIDARYDYMGKPSEV